MVSRSIWDELDIPEVPEQPQPVVLKQEQPDDNVIGIKNKKRIKPKIPKDWNTIVLKPIYKGKERVGTEGWFEYVEEPEGRIRTYVEEGMLWTSKRAMYLMTINETTGEYEAYNPPEFVEYLPEMLHRASRGCDAYSMFLAYKKVFMEKLKTFMIGGILFALLFLIFIMLSE
jgi:hypothetical protein